MNFAQGASKVLIESIPSVLETAHFDVTAMFGGWLGYLGTP